MGFFHRRQVDLAWLREEERLTLFMCFMSKGET
jgi:hypothetical protein